MTDKPKRFTAARQATNEPERYEVGSFSDPAVRAKWEAGGKYHHLREDVRNPQTLEEMDAEWAAFQKEFGYGGPE